MDTLQICVSVKLFSNHIVLVVLGTLFVSFLFSISCSGFSVSVLGYCGTVSG